MKKIIMALSILSTVTLFAATNDSLTKFSAGSPAKASEVSGNFKIVADAVDTKVDKSTFDTLAATVAQLQAQIAKQEMPIGTVISTTLTLEQMTAKYPNGEWVLADGRTATTEYKNAIGTNNIPDLRGVVLRGKNNGRSDGNQNPDGDVTIGTYQNDAFQGHNHGISASTTAESSASFYPVLSSGASNSTNIKYYANAGYYPDTNYPGVTIKTAPETRMKNVTVNFFVKVK